MQLRERQPRRTCAIGGQVSLGMLSKKNADCTCMRVQVSSNIWHLKSHPDLIHNAGKRKAKPIANPRTAKPEKNMTESKPILDHVSEGTECYKMMCRFQFCFQRYLADPVIRGANASYKKPGLNVEQVCRSTLQRNQLFEIC